MSRKELENDTLGNRMKEYERQSTSRTLLPSCPLYARIDGRAFHTFCRGLEKPYSKMFIKTMQETCRGLVDETGAILGYVQSDEISLGWEDYTKAPFDGRVQKLESVIASLASSLFVRYSYSNPENNEVADRIARVAPSFDCRIFNVPDMSELANCFLWRENDAIKNSISSMALSFYSHKQLQNKNSKEKIAMMVELGYDFYKDTPPSFLRGTFYQRETYQKFLTKEEYEKIPEKHRFNLVPEYDSNGQPTGNYMCMRSRVGELFIPFRLTDIDNKIQVLFERGNAVTNKDNLTFDLRGVVKYNELD